MRTILLDTHVALWLLTDSEQLPQSVRETSQMTGIEWIFHQTSTWEIQIKYELGKLPLPQAPAKYLPNAIRETGLSYQRIEDEAIFMLGKLPALHRDPFDRLLIVHAMVHGWEVASVDKQIAEYPVRIFS